MRWNSPRIQFTFFKCASQSLRGLPQCCVATPSPWCQTFVLALEKHAPFSGHSLLPAPSPRPPRTCFLSLRWSVLGISYKETQTTYDLCLRLLVLTVMFFRSLHTVAWTPSSCSWLDDLPLYVYVPFCLSSHLLTDVWVVSTFWPLCRVPLCQQVCAF